VVVGACRLEVRPFYLIGARPRLIRLEYLHISPETLFLILDTRSGTRRDFKTLAEPDSAARQLGGSLRFESVEAIYNRYRYGLVDLIPLGIFAIPPLIGIFFERFSD